MLNHVSSYFFFSFNFFSKWHSSDLWRTPVNKLIKVPNAIIKDETYFMLFYFKEEEEEEEEENKQKLV